MAADARSAIEAVWRIESARLIAGLTRRVRDISLAEELAQDALLAALQQWPETGVPANPGAWLMTAAKRRAVDVIRRNRTWGKKQEELGREAMRSGDDEAERDDRLDDQVGDDVLRLIFMTCHSVLSAEARVALTLRLIGGLTAAEIARAFLTSETTIEQRIVRAKRTLVDKQIPFEVPRDGELTQRLPSVLEVVYLVFNEGYTATAGEHWIRPELCDEALRLGRVLAALMPSSVDMPGKAEVLGLLALMEIQASRLRARVGAGGEPVLLADQNRALWDHLLIRRGLAALEQAERLDPARGPYTLQAAIAACHARAPTAEQTNWQQMAALYEELLQIVPSPVVALNHAVAVDRAFGPQRGLELVDALADEPALRTYHLLPTVRGDLLEKLGRYAEARAEFERAAGMTRNERERAILMKRAADCARK